MEPRDLRSEVCSNLERYPGLAEIFDPRWVDAQFRLGFEKGVHPMLDFLAAPPSFAEDVDRIFATMSHAIALLKRQPNIGSLKSRFNRLRGNPGGSWQDNQAAWQSSICELYLAAWLAHLGYDVTLTKRAGADIQVRSGGNLICQIEVHAPRRTTGLPELINVLRWVDPPFDYDLRVRYTSDEMSLNGSEFEALLGRLTAAYRELNSGAEKMARVRFSNSSGSADIRVGPARSGIISLSNGATALPLLSTCFPDIIRRTNDKAAKGQTDLTLPSILALEIGTYYSWASLQHLVHGPRGFLDFPTEELPKSVAALLVFHLALTTLKPAALTLLQNTTSPWAEDESFAIVLRALTSGSRQA